MATFFLTVLLAATSTCSAFMGYQRPAAVASGRSSTTLSMSAALIVQNKGGGHGELGYQLAKTLQSNPKITSITILQDAKCKYDQEPFKSYATDLPNVRVVNADLTSETMTAADVQNLLGQQSFPYVWDNASKGPVGAGKAIADCARAWNTQLFVYVSSAGMYKPTGVFPMPETTPVKDSAGQFLYENYCVSLGLPLVSFRPQYIYGDKSNKHDYIDWYFDRLVKQLPLPIPGDGTQKVSLTNSEDVASLLAAPLNNEPAAIQQRFFNCGTDQLFSYDEVALMCAEAAFINPIYAKIEHYDGDALGKAKFPFRLTDFYVAPDTAKYTLGWPGAKHNLKEDLKSYYQNFLARGGSSRKVALEADREIVAQTKGPQEAANVYDKYLVEA